MSVPASNTPAASPSYTPPPELLQEAEAMLRDACPEELTLAARAYVAYGLPTGGRSAISGAELPDFDVCRPLVRAGWLAVVRELAPSAPTPIRVDVSALKPEMERLEGMIHQLTSAPVGMPELCHGARALAEAAAFLNTSDSAASTAVADLVQRLALGMREVVRELVPPTQS
jgi:hypothetical protein